MPRETRQRRAIRETLRASGRPLSPGELLASARKKVDGLGIATVYRNLKLLQDEGLITAVELPGAPARYEVSGKDHHHHFHCRSCDRVLEVEGCPGEMGAVAPDGFQVESHEVVLYGLCDACAA